MIPKTKKTVKTEMVRVGGSWIYPNSASIISSLVLHQHGPVWAQHRAKEGRERRLEETASSLQTGGKASPILIYFAAGRNCV